MTYPDMSDDTEPLPTTTLTLTRDEAGVIIDALSRLLNTCWTAYGDLPPAEWPTAVAFTFATATRVQNELLPRRNYHEGTPS
jgi:hypothetical protein